MMRRPNRVVVAGRFALYLLYEFRWTLAVLLTGVFAGGWLLQLTYDKADLEYDDACYAAFRLLFAQADLPLPDRLWLQPVFFLVPVVGIATVVESVARMAYLVFARKRHLPEWQRMVASAYRHHIVVLGVGKVGYRIIKGLLAQREAVVAVEKNAASELVDEVRDLGVPVITGNIRQEKVLREANVPQARCVVVATNDDLANIDAALTARDLNPTVRVVLRLFDDTLAAKFATVFQMPTLSASQVSAPAFIAAATGRRVNADFELGGQPLRLTDLTVQAAGALAGRAVGRVQAEWSVNVVMHRGPAGVNVNPPHDLALAAGDTLLVIAPPEKLLALEAANRGP
jgi:Trk K+ transport system NAD-binding subunit